LKSQKEPLPKEPLNCHLKYVWKGLFLCSNRGPCVRSPVTPLGEVEYIRFYVFSTIRFGTVPNLEFMGKSFHLIHIISLFLTIGIEFDI